MTKTPTTARRRIAPALTVWLMGAVLLATLGRAARAEEPVDGEPATGDGAARLHLSGFGTVGVLHANAPAGWGFLRDMSQRDNQGGTRADIDTRLGLQANYRLTRQIEFVGQLVGANRDPATPPSDIVSLAFGAYTPIEDVVMRAGRLSADYFLLADYRHVGFAYPFVRPPIEAYSTVPYSIDGADLTKSWHLDDALWKLRASVGRTWNERAGVRISAHPAYALILSRDDGEGLLVKATAARVRLHGDDSAVAPLVNALKPFASLPVPNVAADAQGYIDITSFDGILVTYLALGASLERGPWLVDMEWTHYGVASRTYLSGWGFVGRRWGSLTTYAGLSGIRTSPNRPPPQWTDALTPVIGAAGAAQAQALATVAFLSTVPANGNQHTFSLGVRWDFADRMALKLQIDRVHVNAYGSRFWTAGSLEPMNASVGSATLDFVF